MENLPYLTANTVAEQVSSVQVIRIDQFTAIL